MRLLTSKIFATAAVFCVVSCSEKSNQKALINMDSTAIIEKTHYKSTKSSREYFIVQYRLDCVEHVLNKGVEGVNYYFEATYPDVDDGLVDRFYVKNLGSVKNKEVGMIKFIDMRGLYSFPRYTMEGLFIDSARRVYGRLILYNHRNEKLGYYDFGYDYNGPSELKEDSLVFAYNNYHCDARTAITFGDSLRTEIFVSCHDSTKSGDIYNLIEGD